DRRRVGAAHGTTGVRASPRVVAMDGQTRTLPPDLEKRVRKTLEEWAAAGKVRRLWARDASLWTSADEASWLGWLGIAEDQVGRIDRLRRVADDVAREGFTRALLLGMGGSSLCPEVLKETFGISGQGLDWKSTR